VLFRRCSQHTHLGAARRNGVAATIRVQNNALRRRARGVGRKALARAACQRARRSMRWGPNRSGTRSPIAVSSHEPLAQLAPGTLVDDRYRIEALLGEGGFAEVYRATQLNLDRTVALKVLIDTLDSPAFRERFEREARVVAQLRHPSIVTVFDSGFDAKLRLPWISMELIEGH